MDRGAWRATIHRYKESDTTEATQRTLTMAHKVLFPVFTHSPSPPTCNISETYPR